MCLQICGAMLGHTLLPCQRHLGEGFSRPVHQMFALFFHRAVKLIKGEDVSELAVDLPTQTFV